MSKPIIVFIVLVSLIAGLFVYLYYYYEPENNISEEKVSLNIYSQDSKTKEKLESDINIYVDGVLIKEIESEKYASIVYDVFANRSVEILGYNTEGYYNSIKRIKTNISENQRIILNLEKAGSFSLIKEYSSKEKMQINLSYSGNIKNSYGCIDWTSSIAYVDTDIFKKIDAPQEYNQFVKCFEIEPGSYELKIKSYTALDENDKIKIVVFDKDITSNNNQLNVFYEERDLGAKNEVFEFNIN